VRALEARGDEVTVLTRDARRAQGSLGPKVTFEGWGAPLAGPGSAWVQRVQASDVVVHLAGESVADGRWTAERLERMRASRVETARALADAIATAPSKPTFVCASAVGIYGMRKDDLVVDEQGAHGTDVLASICEEVEATTAIARDAGARVAIARIGIALGDGGGALEKMLPAFKSFVGGPIGDGAQWLSWIHVDDAVRGLLFAIDTAGFDGAFNLTAPKPVTMNDFAATLAHAVHRPCAFRVPAFALKLALGEGLAGALLTGQRAVPARLERAGFTFRFETLDAALADIVAPPRTVAL
jgi:uncharacterized protein (TIGR01777 family)